MILPSANCRRTSCTTTAAVRLTARIANDEKRNAIEPPMSSPMNTFGSATLIAVCESVNSLLPVTVSSPGSWFLMVSMYDENSATAAMTAEPIANPFVTALVVLPTASSITMIRCGSPSNSPDTSAISCTGFVSVDVKYSVMRDAICASTSPPTTAPNMRQPTFEIEPPFGLPTYTSANTSVPMIVRMPAVRNPRLIGAIALLSLSVARTENTPTIDA